MNILGTLQSGIDGILERWDKKCPMNLLEVMQTDFSVNWKHLIEKILCGKMRLFLQKGFCPRVKVLRN